MKNTKRAMLLSCLTVLLCLSMLVGSTFAWFTDSVSVAGNKIVAGTLDIELWETSYNDWMDQPGEEGFVEKNITESTEPIFASELWEPGYLAYTNLTVKNVGSLAAKIQAYMIPTGEIGKLAEVIDVYVAYAPLADYYDGYTIRQFFNGEYVLPWGGGMNMFDSYVKHVGTLKDVMEQGINLGLFNEQDAVIDAGGEYQINIALKMREEAGNEYQGQPAGEFDIRILATQATVEEDTFNDQYDKDAEYPIVQGVNDAIKNAVAGETVALSSGNYTLPNSYADGITIDGNGATVALPESEGAWNRINTNNTTFTDITFVDPVTLTGSATFINCTFLKGTDTSTANGDITFENCTFADNGKGFSLHVDAGNGTGNLNVKNCKFTGGAVSFNGFAAVSFEGCEFGGNYSWKYMRIYCPTTLIDCTFDMAESKAYSNVSGTDLIMENVTFG